ncbi:hypothetical protein B0E46_02525 [Rhodanobacter sp. B04]|uniref:hypothetical protein n=1 Tax=Rhodanobacter sp. B04 TaxID=1945860 RepID=UPI0009866061|nr:hypothetical protein [Rhodanobacter sp. B04]OOG66364.1 hypothetical protein B0E46_02525 [Rhodanobacter sp. B04]
MRATHWLIGCTLCIAGIGSVCATSLDAQELDNTQHATADSTSSRDSSAGGGDALGLTRDTPSRGSASESSGSASGNGSDRSNGTSSAPAPSRQPHLGWQSLLPGSIQ